MKRAAVKTMREGERVALGRGSGDGVGLTMVSG